MYLVSNNCVLSNNVRGGLSLYQLSKVPILVTGLLLKTSINKWIGSCCTLFTICVDLYLVYPYNTKL